jgi:hypothetical protein
MNRHVEGGALTDFNRLGHAPEEKLHHNSAWRDDRATSACWRRRQRRLSLTIEILASPQAARS